MVFRLWRQEECAKVQYALASCSPLRNLAIFSRKFQMPNSSKTASFLNQEITLLDINVSPLFCEMGFVLEQKQDLAGHGRCRTLLIYVEVWYQKYWQFVKCNKKAYFIVACDARTQVNYWKKEASRVMKRILGSLVRVTLHVKDIFMAVSTIANPSCLFLIDYYDEKKSTIQCKS